jgi:hypothetical protein
VILLALIALPPAAGAGSARRAGGGLMLIAVLKAADYAMFTALGRGFNPVADLPLIEAGLRLATGAIGPVLTDGPRCLRRWSPWRLRGLGALVGERGLGAAHGTAAWRAGNGGGGRSFSPVSPRPRSGRPWAAGPAALAARRGLHRAGGVERIEMARATLADLRAFEAAAANDPYAARDGLSRHRPRCADRLRGKLRPYEPRHAALRRNPPRHAGRGRGASRRWACRCARGSCARRRAAGKAGSATRPSPTGSGSPTRRAMARCWRAGGDLFHIASEAGFHTAAVMPQITLDWPESALMGFETVLAARTSAMPACRSTG